MQVIEQTHEEKIVMYNKLSKKELIEMLIESNKQLSMVVKSHAFQPYIIYPYTPSPNKYPWDNVINCNNATSLSNNKATEMKYANYD